MIFLSIIFLIGGSQGDTGGYRFFVLTQLVFTFVFLAIVGCISQEYNSTNQVLSYAPLLITIAPLYKGFSTSSTLGNT